MMRPLHVPTVGIVVAAMVTGSLLTAAGVTLTSDPVPTVGTTTVNGASPTIGDPWAWSACVTTVYNMGGGTDADMATCDRLYPVADNIVADCLFNTDEGGQDWGDETARCTWTTREPRPQPTPEPAPEQPDVSHGGNTEPEPSIPPVTDDGGPCAIHGDRGPEREACDDAKEDAADDGGEVGADEWCNADDPGYPCDPATMPPLPMPTVEDTDA